MCSTDLDLGLARQVLQAAGWDVIVGDGELVARLDPAPAADVWTLKLDRSARFRFTAVRAVQPSIAAALHGEANGYRLVVEDQRHMTITGSIDSGERLSHLLADLNGYVQGLSPGGSQP